jgi:hypothetical protein
MTFPVCGIKTCGIIGFLQATFGSEDKSNFGYLKLDFEQVKILNTVYDLSVLCGENKTLLD